MRNEMTFIQHMINAHKFFCRKSQHYVLGNWYEYVKSRREKTSFVINFPKAYLRFMTYAFIDGYRGNRYDKF